MDNPSGRFRLGKFLASILVAAHEYLAAATISAVILLMFVSVILRYSDRPIMWGEEVITLLFLWAIMLGAISSQRNKSHLSVDLLVKAFPPTLRFVTGLVVKTVYVCVLALLIHYGWELSMDAKDKITNMLSIPYTYVDLAIPVGAGGMLIYVLLEMYHDIRDFAGRKSPPPETESAGRDVAAE